MKSISVDELLKIMRNKSINLIDIRSHTNYLLWTIPTALNIEADKLINSPAKYLNLNDEYYIFCEYGYTSEKVGRVLSNYGYKIINILGGFSSYKKR